MKRAVVALAVALALLALSCGKSQNPAVTNSAAPTAPSTPTATPCAVPGAGTGKVESTTSINSAALLKDVRTQGAGCPRVVFEFENAVPPYNVEYRNPPFANCGSGAAVDTSAWGATAYVSVRAEPASGADLGAAGFRQTYKGSKDIAVSSKVLRRVHETCDFESVLEWIIALDVRHPFKVTTLGSPPRIVIDISGG